MYALSYPYPPSHATRLGRLKAMRADKRECSILEKGCQSHKAISQVEIKQLNCGFVERDGCNHATPMCNATVLMPKYLYVICLNPARIIMALSSSAGGNQSTD